MVRRVSRRVDLVVAALCLALAVWVTGGMWLDPNGRTIEVNSGDQALFEWLLAYGAHAVRVGEDPLFTHLLNVPIGVNLAVNTSITVYAVAFAPLTWAFGPPVTFLVILTLNLAATGYAWYWLLSRHLGASPWGAAVGGLFCAFAPGLVSHANAHLNWTAQWLVPLIVWRLLALRTSSPWRGGPVLGVLVAVMFSIAAEGLFFLALALGTFVLVWSLFRPAEARLVAGSFLRGLGVAALTAGVLLAYPLWLHFLGPQRYDGIGFDQRIHAEDLKAFGAFPDRSIAGWLGFTKQLAPNPTEETTFFGLPLLLLVVVAFVVLWRRADSDRRAVLGALGVTGVVFAVLSLGPRLKWDGVIHDVPLPFALMAHLPVFNAALPARLALVVIPVIGIVLAYLVSFRIRSSWFVALALLPLVPLPLLTVHRDPVPEFFASGQWRTYVTDGGTVVPLPLPSDLLPDGQRWQASAFASGHGEFSIPAGFFLGPGGPDGRGRIGPVPRPTATLLYDAAQTGVVPVVTDADRARAAEDLRYWRAEIVVLADQVHGAKWTVHYDALRETATALFGPPQRVADVWLWRAACGQPACRPQA